MGVSISDLIVHVDETLPHEEMAKLEEIVRADACVVSACTSHETPHLLLVTYNPDCANSSHILGLVTRQGHHAELVGL